MMLGRMTLITLETAFRTPFPWNRFMSPSRNSKASWIPVDAPEGTVPRPLLPSLVQTSTSIVGFPLESRTCLAFTSVILEPPEIFFDDDPHLLYDRVAVSFF